MGQSYSQYNPFTDIGRYNIKNYVYENKNTVTAVMVIAIILVVVIMFVLYSEDIGIEPLITNNTQSFPPPQYGYGPYGFGLYLPPKSVMEELEQN